MIIIKTKRSRVDIVVLTSKTIYSNLFTTLVNIAQSVSFNPNTKSHYITRLSYSAFLQWSFVNKNFCFLDVDSNHHHHHTFSIQTRFLALARDKFANLFVVIVKSCLGQSSSSKINQTLLPIIKIELS